MCHEHYMSTYLYIWFISYVQTDLAKLLGSTRGFESIEVIIEPTFSYHLRRLDYASVTTDHTENTKDCQFNTLKILFRNRNLS